MVKDNTNPFVLPGFGQSGDAAQNPLIASMEMMRSAWEGLAKVGGFEQVLGSNTSAQDLEKRIADLRAVEQWLRMNLSMLSSTIQALEVQQATVSTINTFLSTVSTSTTPSTQVPPSPLEVALGLRPSVGKATEQPSSDTNESIATQQAQETPKPETSIPEASKADAEPAKPASGDSTGLFTNPTETMQQASDAVQAAQQAQIEQAVQATQVAEDATKRWWGLLQNQFDTLAEAAAATVQGVAQPVAETATETVKKEAPKKTTAKKVSTKKSTPKKTTKKTVAKVSVAKKTSPKAATKAAVNVAAKKTAVKAATKTVTTKAVTAKKATAKTSTKA